MLYQIIETRKGTETIKLVDSLPRCNRRLKELRSSACPGATYKIEVSLESAKREHITDTSNYKSGG